jgi:hypothetical protein
MGNPQWKVLRKFYFDVDRSVITYFIPNLILSYKFLKNEFIERIYIYICSVFTDCFSVT